MSIKQAPYYWLECDGLNDDGTVCGVKSTEGGDYAAWADESQAVEDATCSDWEVSGIDPETEKHYCPEHSEMDDEDDE